MSDPAPAPRLLVAGDTALDVVVRPRGPVRWGDDTPSAVELRPGGQGANVATWARHAGAEAHLYTQIGRDDVGRMLARAIRARGVVLHARRSERTTRVVSLADADGRSLFADLGPGLWAPLPTRRPPAGSILYLSGYVLARPGGRQWLATAKRWARRMEVRVAVTPSAVSAVEGAGVDAWAELAEGATVVVMNATEACAVTGTSDLIRASRALAWDHPVVLVTDGPRGAVWAHDGRFGSSAATAPNDGVVDATGAGDATIAAFLAALLTGQDPMAACATAMVAGGQAITALGAWPAV